MSNPPLLILQNEAEYQGHYLDVYVRKHLTTSHGIRVHFRRNTFSHAFYESSRRDGIKDQFSTARAQRMDWIGITLNHPDSIWYQGWIKITSQYDETRTVAVAYEDFVVVLQFYATQMNQLAANFVTCYVADNSIDKIQQAPLWDINVCRTALGI